YFHVTGVQTCALPIFLISFHRKHFFYSAYRQVFMSSLADIYQLHFFLLSYFLKSFLKLNGSLPSFLAQALLSMRFSMNWDKKVRSEEHTSELQSRENL